MFGERRLGVPERLRSTCIRSSLSSCGLLGDCSVAMGGKAIFGELP